MRKSVGPASTMSARKPKKNGMPPPEKRRASAPSARRRESTTAKSSSSAQPKTPKVPFYLPPEFSEDPGRFDFWTIRMPASMPLQDLAGCQLSTSAQNQEEHVCKFTSSSAVAASKSAADSDKATHVLRFGHPTENDAIRMLLLKSQLGFIDGEANNDNDEDDEEEESAEAKKNQMIPLPKRFVRHVNVLEYFEERSERELAPHPDQAPKVQSTVGYRVAYSHVPQKTGLKRRWQPIGCNASQGGGGGGGPVPTKKNHHHDANSGGKGHSLQKQHHHDHSTIDDEWRVPYTPEQRKTKHAEKKHAPTKQESTPPPTTKTITNHHPNADAVDSSSKGKLGEGGNASSSSSSKKRTVSDFMIKEEENEGIRHHAKPEDDDETGAGSTPHFKIKKEVEEKSSTSKKEKKESKEAKREAKRAKKEAKKARKSAESQELKIESS